MNNITNKIRLRNSRRARIRAKISGTAVRPRLSVFRSNKHIWAQLIDDVAGKTLAACSDFDLSKEQQKLRGIERAKEVGVILAQKALKVKISAAVFDRGGYLYHGRVKSLAEGFRSQKVKL